MYKRQILQQLLEALSDTPVVLLNGARQTGKSTLARELTEKREQRRYFTLDDATVLSAVKRDPQGFIDSLEGPCVIDEIQRIPDLFLAIKANVDRERTPGRFLLTGSANVLLLPRLSESLAGRMEILTLWPLSQQELSGRLRNLVEALFSGEIRQWTYPPVPRSQLVGAMIRGGYPEAQARSNERRRHAWFSSYITTLLDRDVRDLANIEGLTELPRLLAILAARSAGLLNASDLSRSMGIPLTTLRRYLTLLEATFLITTLPAWTFNPGKRFVKAPKIFINDSGLMSYLLGYEPSLLEEGSGLPGALFETFVHGELAKYLAAFASGIRLFHFRTFSGTEVDFILENRRGEIVGIEAKASSSLSSKDWSGLRQLKETLADRFLHGYVIYTGRETIPLGRDFTALPAGVFF